VLAVHQRLAGRGFHPPPPNGASIISHARTWNSGEVRH
jgi:hypothetical protein